MTAFIVGAVAAGLVGIVAAAVILARRRNMQLWLPAWWRGDWAGHRQRARTRGRTVHVMFCMADHFEPAHKHADAAEQRRRVARWVEEYPRWSTPFRDSDGRPPRQTFFYPAEQYLPEHLEALRDLCARGHGEVEIHLHHDNDTSAGMRATIEEFKTRLRSHGHLGFDRTTGQPRYAFVHGNWALDNSRRDGCWCGVNDELRVLRQTGCYADFTLPSAPSDTQTRRINSIYYAVDDPDRPKSHDDGDAVRVGGKPSGDLLIVQGPLTLTWPGRFGLLPRVEAGNIGRGSSPCPPRRLAAWLRMRVSVVGRPDWVFIKTHTHGCDARNQETLFGGAMAAFHRNLTETCNDGARFRLHYVTAREVYNIIKAAERGLEGDPGRYRDLDVAPPPLFSASET